MADLETEAEWAKSKRIEAEKMKAARDMETRAEDKSALAEMPIVRAHGFSRDPNVIMKNAERMANISIVFGLLGIIFGIFVDVFGIVAEANHLGLAGAGIAMVLSIVNAIGVGVAMLTGVVALGCTIVFARRTKYKVRPIIITASVSLILIVTYYLARYFIMR